MNNRYVPEEELRTSRVTVQVNKKEKDMIKFLAKKEGLNVGAYIRKIAIHDKWKEFFNDY